MWCVCVFADGKLLHDAKPQGEFLFWVLLPPDKCVLINTFIHTNHYLVQWYVIKIKPHQINRVQSCYFWYRTSWTLTRVIPDWLACYLCLTPSLGQLHHNLSINTIILASFSTYCTAFQSNKVYSTTAQPLFHAFYIEHQIIYELINCSNQYCTIKENQNI